MDAGSFSAQVLAYKASSASRYDALSETGVEGRVALTSGGCVPVCSHEV